MTTTGVVINTFEANDLLRLAREALAVVEGLEVKADTDRTFTQVRADLTKQLLFSAHLIDKARIAVMDEYFAAKGETQHLTEES